MPIAKKGEYIKKDFTARQVLYFRDEKNDIDIPSREIYKGKKLEVHFPFKKDGAPKYKYITSIEFQNIAPKDTRGIYKSVAYGWGFTKNISPVIYRLEKFPKIRKVILSPKLKSKIDSDKITFNTKDLATIFSWIKPLKDGQSQELKKMANNALAEVFPKKIKHEGDKYIEGSLSVFIKDKVVTKDELSEDDTSALIQIIPDHITKESLLYKTEEKINFIKLNAIKDEFKKLITQKTDSGTLEEKCQRFFTDNHWILSNVLSIPVALLEGKAYVGGKTYKNKSGKIADFLYRNKLTHSVFIIEIKTPNKRLIDIKTPYRKPDVFSLSKELTGGLVQVLDQKDSLQKEFFHISAGEFISFNPKALLVIGRLADLSKKQIKSFELFRGNLRDVEVITYDELFARTNLVLGQFTASK